MQGTERNYAQEGSRQGSGCHAEEDRAGWQHVHLRRRLFSLGRRQDQGSSNFPSTCSPKANGDCTTTALHIVLVRQFHPLHRGVVLLLLARRVRRSPFPPWGLGGLLRRRRYSIRPSRKLISKRKAAAAAQDATERECWWAPPTIWGQ